MDVHPTKNVSIGIDPYSHPKIGGFHWSNHQQMVTWSAEARDFGALNIWNIIDASTILGLECLRKKKTSFGKSPTNVDIVTSFQWIIQWEFQWLRRLRWWFACPQGMHGAKPILTNQRGSGTSDPCHPRSHQSILYPSGCGVSFESYAIHLVIPSLPHNV